MAWLLGQGGEPSKQFLETALTNIRCKMAAPSPASPPPPLPSPPSNQEVDLSLVPDDTLGETLTILFEND